MCIICIEFNKRQDIRDAARMVEAARREADSISPEHLNNIERELEKMQAEDTVRPLASEDDQ